VNDITMTFHHRDLHRILNALRHSSTSTLDDRLDIGQEIQLLVELIRQVEIALGVESHLDDD